MPISVDSDEEEEVLERRRRLLRAAKERDAPEDGDGKPAMSPEAAEAAMQAVLAGAEADRGRKREEYQAMVSDTGTIPLQKLVFSPAGVALFDELCLRVDINQAYAECLPQWGDLANVLEMDELRTKWIKACVRPSEGLTRALLEIYMKDGGTVGEVLGALLKLDMLETLEMLKPRVRAFVKEREIESQGQQRQSAAPTINNPTMDAKFFSILATLTKAFGDDDPCGAMLKFAGGLRLACRGGSGSQQIQSPQVNNELLVQTALMPSLDRAFFDPGKHASGNWDLLAKEKKKEGEEGQTSQVCRILLIYSEDGMATANEVYRKMQGYEHEGVRAEVFRLAESSLWYEVLSSPEACCQKWAGEADYVVPVLTEGFLRDIHGSDGGFDGPLLPTSPLLNRYLYSLLRARYAAAGCRNRAVRPVVPAQAVRTAGVTKVAQEDPLFRLVWTPAEDGKLERRARGMLAEVARRAMA